MLMNTRLNIKVTGNQNILHKNNSIANLPFAFIKESGRGQHQAVIQSNLVPFRGMVIIENTNQDQFIDRDEPFV